VGGQSGCTLHHDEYVPLPLSWQTVKSTCQDVRANQIFPSRPYIYMDTCTVQKCLVDAELSKRRKSVQRTLRARIKIGGEYVHFVPGRDGTRTG
jgi:hypothetical protein